MTPLIHKEEVEEDEEEAPEEEEEKEYAANVKECTHHDWCSDSSVDSDDMMHLDSLYSTISKALDPTDSPSSSTENENTDVVVGFTQIRLERSNSKVRFDASFSLIEYEPPENVQDLYYSCHELQKMLDQERQRQIDLESVGK